MTSARLDTLARLQGAIDRLETGTAEIVRRVSLGHAEADATLQGGLALGALHEVFADGGRHGAAATGFVAAMAGRAGHGRPLLWVRQDFAEREAGLLSMAGLCELGLDPRKVVIVRAPDVEAALRTAADALACDALGSVVLEIWGDTHQFDLVASRKLTLAARASGVTCVALRIAAAPTASTAETRWIVRAAHSPPPRFATPSWQQMWGAPVLDARLVRNRHGPNGHWIMEWMCDECLFRERPATSQPVAAVSADRPYPPAAFAQRRAS